MNSSSVSFHQHDKKSTRRHSGQNEKTSFIVSIIIPVYNKVEYTKKCIESIKQSTPHDLLYETIVVDNASTDGTQNFLESLGSDIKVITNGENLGFARACNQGAIAAKGQLLCFLNNDTVPVTGWLQTLINAANQPNVGIVGAKLLYPDGRIQHAGIEFINGIPDHPYRYALKDAQEVNRYREMDMVTGACFVISRKLFYTLEGFDEIYRNGVEDVDLCIRVRLAGFKVVYEPKAVIFHDEGQSEGRFSHVNENLRIFFNRWKNRFKRNGQLKTPEATGIIPSEISVLKEQTLVLRHTKDNSCNRTPGVLREAELLNKADALYQKGAYHEAIDAYKKITEYHPTFFNAYYNLGLVYASIHQPDEAISFLKKAIELNGNEASAFNNLGVLYFRKRMHRDAKNCFEKALTLDPDYKEAQQNLAKVSGVLRNIPDFMTGNQVDNTVLMDSSSGSFPQNDKKSIRCHSSQGNKSGIIASIIIPVFNKVEYTKKCLEALFKNTPGDIYEVIVVDNASSDETPEFLKHMGNKLNVITNKENMGFTDACNQGAKIAKGNYLVFLNNDTEPQAGWLESMIKLAASDSKIGIVGSKLVYPDGRLQEAGGIIFSDGSGSNFGRGGNPYEDTFNDACEVDYCSGACLLVRKELFENIGGMDHRYSPAYYEETDLCFAARGKGYTVMYAPNSIVIHHESITAGDDTSSGFKKYLEINRKKFVGKWKDTLALQDTPPRETGMRPVTADRKWLGRRHLRIWSFKSHEKRNGKVLIFLPHNPFPPRTGAHRRTLSIVEAFNSMNYDIALFATRIYPDNEWTEQFVSEMRKRRIQLFLYDGTAGDKKYIEEKKALKKNFVESGIFTPPGLCHALSEVCRSFDPDVVLVNYSYYAGLVRDTVFSSRIKLIEVHDLVTLNRKMADALLMDFKNKDFEQIADIDYFSKRQLSADESEYRHYDLFDGTIALSVFERNCIKANTGQTKPFYVPMAYEPQRLKNTYSGSPLFAIGDNLFNMQGYVFFAMKILPRLLKDEPQFELQITGDGSKQIPSTTGIRSRGFVDDISSLYQHTPFTICPLIGGTGQQIKIVESMAYGVPAIALANIAASSPIEHGVNGFIAANEDEFANYVMTLFRDRDLCRRMGEAARKKIEAAFSKTILAGTIQNIITYLKAEKCMKRLNPFKSSFSEQFWNRNYERASTLLIRCAPAIGDALYLTAIVMEIKKRYPHIRIYLSGNHVVEAVFRSHQAVYAFVPDTANIDSLPKTDIIIDYNNVFAHLPEYYNGIGIMDIMANIAGVRLGQRGIVYTITPEEREWAQKEVRTFSPSGGMLIGLHFTTDKDIKRSYPHGEKVISLLSRQFAGARFILFGKDPLDKENHLVYDCTSRQISLRNQIAISSHCNAFITIDSAFFHIGHNFCCKPTLLICGLTSPELLGNPATECFTPIRNEALPCLSCYWRTKCTIECMDNLLPEVIVDAFKKMMNDSPKKLKWQPSLETVEAGILPNEDYEQTIIRNLESKKKPIRLVLHDPHHVLPVYAEEWNGVVIKRDSGKAAAGKPGIIWEGSQFVTHSLALINRELCLQLIREGYEVSLLPYEPDQFGAEADPRFKALAERMNKPLTGTTDVHVRHHWPPNLTPPPEGHWVIIQPWEFGSLPREWIPVFSTLVDELWVPGNYVRNVYIESGVPGEKVFVIPNGINPERFRPDAKPYPLTTKKKFKFLFVGGTIYRKGIDLLLQAYLETFKDSDEVCLVIKDMGGNSFYAGQTFREEIERIQQMKGMPEVEYIEKILSEDEITGLYTASNVLVHPYRGEGFGLPILEAMACGIPVIVTNGGACLDFCNEKNSLLVQANKKISKEKRVGNRPTVGNLWFYEVDINDLKVKMRYACEHPEKMQTLGKEISPDIRNNWTWERATNKIKERIEYLRKTPICRYTKDNLYIRISDVSKAAELLNRADALFQEGAYQEAIDACKKAIECNPVFFDAYNNLGLVYASINQLDEAISTLKKAIELNGKEASVFNNLGVLYYKKKMHSEARRCFEKALAIDAGYKEAHQNLEKVSL